MSEFFAEYGLWLLIALLVVIVLVFLLAGRKRDADTGEPPAASFVDRTMPPPAAVAAAPLAQPEPVVAEPAPEAPPPASPAAAPVAAPGAASDADNLLLLKGVGPKLAALLGELGVTSFAQIAVWTDADIAAIDEKLGAFKGRPTRDQWVDQAKLLAAGDAAGYEARYGKL
jgi:predicted flap endonuclease-1-like 5' DNA nuclease